MRDGDWADEGKAAEEVGDEGLPIRPVEFTEEAIQQGDVEGNLPDGCEDRADRLGGGPKTVGVGGLEVDGQAKDPSQGRCPMLTKLRDGELGSSGDTPAKKAACASLGAASFEGGE